MMGKMNFEDLHQIIVLNEQIFIPSIIKNAGQYLKNARNKEGDWGYYKGFPLDIHASARAIEALVSMLFIKELIWMVGGVQQKKKKVTLNILLCL
ncbi:MAG: hypothetical protein KAR20_16410 [Candidatus Heimdallarchaeota archaeon]|nr:hypothetical protein [Candidatus Heimdallarchaeota archaeon]